jgi:hypothetical protein
LVLNGEIALVDGLAVHFRHFLGARLAHVAPAVKRDEDDDDDAEQKRDDPRALSFPQYVEHEDEKPFSRARLKLSHLKERHPALQPKTPLRSPRPRRKKVNLLGSGKFVIFCQHSPKLRLKELLFLHVRFPL